MQSDNSTVSHTGIFSIPLVRELVIILIIKLSVLYLIWLAFFSTPVSPHLTSEDVGNALLGDQVVQGHQHKNKSVLQD